MLPECDLTYTLDLQKPNRFQSLFNYPIETVFSKAKNVVKQIVRSRLDGTLADFILQGIQAITLEDCTGYFHHMTSNIINAAAGLPYVHK